MRLRPRATAPRQHRPVRGQPPRRRSTGAPSARLSRPPHRGRTAARLDPVGARWLPGPGRLLRLVTLAGLLLTAAVALLTGMDERPSAGPAPGQPSPAPAAAPAPAGPGAQVPGQGAQVPGSAGQAPGSPGAASPPDRLSVPAGLVGVPVPLADPAGLVMLRPGDRIDLLALPAGADPVPVAGHALVLAVDHAAAAVLVGLPRQQAEVILGTDPTTRFAVILRA